MLRFHLPHTFGELAHGRANNFNLLRMVAASLVLLSHSYALTGHSPDEPLAVLSRGHVDAALIGVAVFFAISGFLIAQSLARRRSFAAYVKARLVRIVPGLVFSTLVTVAVIGPLATTLPPAEYWRHPETWRYAWRTLALSLDAQPGLPGAFAANPFPVAANGSLWTIPVELWCYAVLGAIAFAGLLARERLFAALAAAAVVLYGLAPQVVSGALPMDARLSTAQLVATFLFAATLFAHRARVPMSLGLAALVAAAITLALDSVAFRYLLFAGTAYIVLVLAYHPRVDCPAYRRLGDYSYGTYLLAFPVQQLLVAKAGVRDPVLLFALAFLATLALAGVSWHLVEKRALALKVKNEPRERADGAREQRLARHEG